MLHLLMLMIFEIPIMISFGMKTSLSESLEIIKGDAMLHYDVFLNGWKVTF